MVQLSEYARDGTHARDVVAASLRMLNGVGYLDDLVGLFPWVHSSSFSQVLSIHVTTAGFRDQFM